MRSLCLREPTKLAIDDVDHGATRQLWEDLAREPAHEVLLEGLWPCAQSGGQERDALFCLRHRAACTDLLVH